MSNDEFNERIRQRHGRLILIVRRFLDLCDAEYDPKWLLRKHHFDHRKIYCTNYSELCHSMFNSLHDVMTKYFGREPD